jgi:hypothetical protein
MLRNFLSTLMLGTAIVCYSIAARAATPKEAVGFFGTVTGVVKSTAPDGSFFVLTVSKAVADEKQSAIKDTGRMVGKDLHLGTRMPKTKEGVPHPNPEDVAYIKTLKPGDGISIKVFAVHADPRVLRMLKPGEPSDAPGATHPAGK